MSTAFGVVFGVLWAWFWVTGSVHFAVYLGKQVPPWLKRIAGRPKEKPLLGEREAHVLAQTISVILLVGTLISFLVLTWAELRVGDLNAILIATSFPSFLVLTWVGIVWSLERFLQRISAPTRDISQEKK